MNTKEKNIITVDLTNDEKIVFSQLGINPLIKLGKEYLTSNNFVRLKDNLEKEKTLSNKKTAAKKIKKISKSKKVEEIEINNEANANSKDKSQKTNENEEVSFLEKKNELEPTDEINNARKKRRRSSASIE